MYGSKIPRPKRRWKGTLLPVAVIILIMGLTVSMLSVFYVRNLQGVFTDEVDSNLSEVAAQISQSLRNTVKLSASAVRSTAYALGSLNESSQEQVQEFLVQERDTYDYQNIIVVELDGSGITDQGQRVDLKEAVYFKKAAGGESVAAMVTEAPLGGEDAVLFATPVQVEGRIERVVVAVKSLKSFRNSISTDYMKGEGFFQITDVEGNAVVRSDHPYAQNYAQNYIEEVLETGRCDVAIEDVREDMRQRKSGVLRLTLRADGPGGQERTLCYSPVGVNDWYIFTIVPDSVITQKSSAFLHGTILACLIISIVFIALVAFVSLSNHRRRTALEKSAFTDPITGGISLSRFLEEADGALGRAKPMEYALINVNLSQFKLINDAYGMKNGNRTLAHIYRCLVENMAQGEAACRTSADSFNILVKYDGDEHLRERCETFVRLVNAYNEEIDDPYYLVFTIGIFIIEDPKLDFVSMQERANIARQGVKRLTGDHTRIAFYDSADRERMIREKEIENRMERALQEGEFQVYLQPKFDLASRKVAGAEALVRWRDPEKGLVPPDSFIHIFEKNQFIAKLDSFVFEEVCKKLADWRRRGIHPVPISVNLSKANVNNAAFLQRYEQMTREYGIPEQYIEIELTETMFFGDKERLFQVIERLHRLGFRCSLDDFGSGYSSLNTLKEIPVDTIKLDRAFFVTDGSTMESERGASIVESVIMMAKRLNMHVVAEGVESTDQVEFLSRVHCDMVQGFIFARPMPMAAFEKYLMEDRALDKPEA